MEQYIELKDIAKQMKVTTAYLYKLVRKKKFPMPYTRFGDGRGVIRVKQSDLENYLENRKVINE